MYIYISVKKNQVFEQNVAEKQKYSYMELGCHVFPILTTLMVYLEVDWRDG